jgi:hypothetical protein
MISLYPPEGKGSANVIVDQFTHGWEEKAKTDTGQ